MTELGAGQERSARFLYKQRISDEARAKKDRKEIEPDKFLPKLVSVLDLD